MRREDVQVWLERYIAAWSSYDQKSIGDLFSEDCEYRYQPWADPVVGRDAIVADWLSDKDEPGSWSAHYDVWAFDGERASAVGESRYTNPDGSFRTLYYNHYQLRFDGHGGRVGFIAYSMELPERVGAVGLSVGGAVGCRGAPETGGPGGPPGWRGREPLSCADILKGTWHARSS